MLVGKNLSAIIALGAGIVIGLGLAYFGLQENRMPENVELQEILKYIREINPGHGIQDEALTNASASNHSSDQKAQIRDNAEAERLAKEVRVLCWVMTNPENDSERAVHVKNTWGKRCSKLIFMSSKSDEKLGTVVLPNVQEGRFWLWAKTKEAFKYVWEHHRDDADWFMKADDDTYVILENLRYMLSEYDPNDPIYFGLLFRPFVDQGYMAGGPGYVLSKEALRRFIEQALPDKDKCEQSHDGAEDVEIGKCMEAVGVKVGDTRDALDRYRFMEFPPENHVSPGYLKDSWYWGWAYHPQEQGMDCCSQMPISFHYVPPHQMDGLEYLIYHVRLYGVSRDYDWNNEPKLNRGHEGKAKTPW